MSTRPILSRADASNTTLTADPGPSCEKLLMTTTGSTAQVALPDLKGEEKAETRASKRWICDNPHCSSGGWAGWMAEDLSTSAMVPTLILQAFATG